jgi:hypothetical protein
MVVENYVGCGACIRFPAMYDANAIIPLLLTVFEVLNPTIQACAVEVVGYVAGFSDFIEKNSNIFGVGASMVESSCALVVGKLFCSGGYLYPLLHVLIP